MIREGVPFAPLFFTLPPGDPGLSAGGNVAASPIANQTILAVFPPGEDRASIDKILERSEWKLQFTGTLEETQTALSTIPFAVVLSEGRLTDGYCWKDILHLLHDMSSPPVLIVADRLADEALWVEVLNLGGYDLLTKPFDTRELLHAVTAACLFGEEQTRRAEMLRKPPKSAGYQELSGPKKRAATSGQ